MDIVKSISVLLIGGKSGFRKPTCLGHDQISGCYGTSSAYPKKLTSACLNWIFHFWSYICSLAFCKINRNKEKRVIPYGTSKGGEKVNLNHWLCGGFFSPLLQLYIIYWFCRFSHDLTGQTSTSLSWREVWEGVENKDLKYIYHSKFWPFSWCPLAAIRDLEQLRG